MKKVADYSELIRKAKDAVESVDDPFKIPAFSAILTKLLDGKDNSTTIPSEQKKELARKSDERQIDVGPKAWIRELIEEGYFKQPKNSKDILEILDERGHILKPQDITRPLADLVKERFLRRKKMSPQKGNKAVVRWMNW